MTIIGARLVQLIFNLRYYLSLYQSIYFSFRSPGKAGEAYFARWLQKKYYWIVTRNWQIPSGELDLIALYDDTLHIVEVKTRHVSLQEDFSGDLAIDYLKMQKLRNLAEQYLYREQYYIQRFKIKNFQFDTASLAYKRFFCLYFFEVNFIADAFGWRSRV